MTDDYSTCRLCGKSEGEKIKYGVRHYAHAECALTKWGAAFFDRLKAWQLGQFPAMVAKRAGVLDELIRRVENAKEEA